MKRYVRTSDGRILDFNRIKLYAESYSFNNQSETHLSIEWDVIREEIDIVKQADTIEELCDEIVIHYANGYHLITINNGEVTFKDDFDYGFKLKFVLENEIYGEIWVDGELRKVAKMNEKGELELL